MYNYLENIKKLYPQAQEKIKEIIKFYEDNKDGLLSSNNLKVYDVSYYVYSEMEKDFPLTFEANKNSFDGNGIFDYFCQTEYDFFENENNLNVLQYIRNTSTFYFVPEKLIKRNGSYAYCDYKNKNIFLQTIFDFIIYEECNSNILGLTDKHNIIFEYNKDYFSLEEVAEDIENELQTLIDFNIYELFKDCLQVYNYLTEFKKNQVEIFKTYCEDEEELQREEKEKEENKHKQKKEKLSVLKEIINCYLNIHGDNIAEGNNGLILDILGEIENELLKR